MSDTPSPPQPDETPAFSAGVLPDDDEPGAPAAVPEAETPEEAPQQGSDALPANPEDIGGRAAMLADRNAAEPDDPDDPKGPMLPVRDREFTLVAELPAAVVLDVGALGDESLSMAEKFSIQRTVAIEIIHPSERAEWRTFIRRARPVLGFEELTDIIRAALEAIFGRPTE